MRQAFSSPWPVSHQVPVQPKVQPKRLLRLLRLLLLEVLLKKCCVLLGHTHHIRTVIIMDLVFAGEYHVCWLAKMFPLKCVPNKIEKYVLAINHHADMSLLRITCIVGWLGHKVHAVEPPFWAPKNADVIVWKLLFPLRTTRSAWFKFKIPFVSSCKPHVRRYLHAQKVIFCIWLNKAPWLPQYEFAWKLGSPKCDGFKIKLSYLNMALLGNTLCKTTQDVENQILGL